MLDLNSLLSRKPPPMLGLDISASSVKMVELDQDRAKNLVLDRLATASLKPGLVQNGNIEELDEVASVVRKLLKKSGSNTKNAVVALPPSAVITKKIVLPSGLSDQDMELQVETEAGQYIPFPLDEVSLDFCVVGPAADEEDSVEVLIAASRYKKVQDLEALAEAAGIRLMIVDIESYASRLAACRLIDNSAHKAKGSVVALFELGTMTTSMQVISNHDTLFERDQDFGGMQLTQSISRHYGIPVEEAEARKRSGDLPNDYRQDVLNPFVANLGQEIGRALRFFFSSTAYNKVDAVMLAGSSASLSGLAAAVTQQTGFACSVVNPFEGMTLSPAVGKLPNFKQQAPSYLTACGLALRRFSR